MALVCALVTAWMTTSMMSGSSDWRASGVGVSAQEVFVSADADGVEGMHHAGSCAAVLVASDVRMHAHAAAECGSESRWGVTASGALHGGSAHGGANAPHWRHVLKCGAQVGACVGVMCAVDGGERGSPPTCGHSRLAVLCGA